MPLKILDLGNNRGRFLCSCGALFESRNNYSSKLLCKNCNFVTNGYGETPYLNTLINLGYKAVVQQYTHHSLVSKKGNKLRYDIALFNNIKDIQPYIIFEVLSYNDHYFSNQGGHRENYLRKVLFARDDLKVPLVELNLYKGEEPKKVISEAINNYNSLKEIKNKEEYHKTLLKTFYNPITERIGWYSEGKLITLTN